MDQVENQTAPSSQNLPERPSFWYLLRNPPTYHKPLVTLVAVTFFLSALGTLVYFTTIGKGQISFFPPSPAVTQQPVVPTSALPTPTPDLYTESSRSATANWRTYRNIELGVSFKYPNDYKLANGYFYPVDSKLEYRNEKIGAFHVGTKNKQDPNRCNYFNKDEDQEIEYKAEDTMLITSNPLLINGMQGIRETLESLFTYDIGGDGKLYVTNYCLNHGDKEFTLSLYGYDREPYPSDQETFDQILSTFQFTD